jgi:DNA-directed RNA polymerase specialized sigma24 family protein
MTSPAEGSVTQFFVKLRQGDPTAADELWRRFFPRLVGLARKTLSGRPVAVADAEDAVQSALFSFWQRARRGDFGDDLGRDNLWNLLGVITVRKALKHQERERALKRGGGKVFHETALSRGAGAGGTPFRLDDTLSSVPAVEFDLRCEELLLMLDEELRRFALLKLLGHATPEIAAQLDCTERKVQRKLNLVRMRWERELEP